MSDRLGTGLGPETTKNMKNIPAATPIHAPSKKVTRVTRTSAPARRRRSKLELDGGLRGLHEWYFANKVFELNFPNEDTMDQELLTLFEAAAGYGIAPDPAAERIREAILLKGYTPDDRQIWNAREIVFPSSGGRIRRETKFRPDRRERFASVVRNNFDYVALTSILRKSSVLDPRNADLRTIFGCLYDPGDKILLLHSDRDRGSSLYEVGTPVPTDLPTEDEESLQFRINPIGGTYDQTGKPPKRSRRAESAVTAYRYMLLRSSEHYEKDWLKILMMAPLPISAIFRDGRDSWVNALLQIDASGKAEFDAARKRLSPIVQTLGGDLGAMGADQLSVLPTAFLDEFEDEAGNVLFYLNPSPTSRPIIFE